MSRGLLMKARYYNTLLLLPVHSFIYIIIPRIMKLSP